MEDSKHSADDTTDKDNVAYLKRREQVRRAQRSHRERKEQYVKSLENEIWQLRTSEAKIRQEKDHLETEIGRLKHIIDQCGIADGSPSECPSSSPLLDTLSPPEGSSFDNYMQPYYQPSSVPAYISECGGSLSLANTISSRPSVRFLSSREPSEPRSIGGSSPSRRISQMTDGTSISTPESTWSIFDQDQLDLNLDMDFTCESHGLLDQIHDGYWAASQTSATSMASISAPHHLAVSTQPILSAGFTSAPHGVGQSTSVHGTESWLGTPSGLSAGVNDTELRGVDFSYMER